MFSKDDIEAPQKFRGGLVATDVLSIYAVVVPIESKEIPDVIAGTMEALQKMGKKPQIIYTDDEGAVTSNDFRQYVEDEGIVLYRTRGHPEFAERFASSSHVIQRARVSTRSRKTYSGSN